MANVSVDQALERVQRFHARLADLYAGLQDSADDARVPARCMAGREARLSRALQGYRKDPANAVTLGAWFKVDPLPRELGASRVVNCTAALTFMFGDRLFGSVVA